ncbi:MAG: chorismate mutase [Clostridia bacterium]|nr:chorismate mutase [Clostridia bacterium]
MQLDEIRKKIDDVDARICALLNERFDLVKEVAKAKKESGSAVENKAREDEVLKRVRELVPDDLKDYAEEVFRILIKDSKDLQRKL